ncbi:hypothetical protein GGF32_000348 [Allomyces javanicus]|nr:hypothetical protein GGF32_000348 [Allomyces javanicus]
MITLDALRSVKGVIKVLSALPRNGLEYLHLTLYNRDEFELEYGGERKSDVHAQLVASLPTSVKRLSFYSTLQLPRLPLATHALFTDVETLAMLDPLPFAQTLRHLELYSNHDYITDADLLVRVFGRLPATLTRLKVHENALPGRALAALAQSLPPQLESLSLIFCDLTAADMDQHLANRWPSTLRRLNLYGNYFRSGLPAIPFGVRFLSVSVPEALRQTGGVDAVTAWVASLPPTLRVLDLHWDRASDNGDLLAALLLENLNILPPGRTWRVQLRIYKESVSAETLALLRDKFDLVDAFWLQVSYDRPHPSAAVHL